MKLSQFLSRISLPLVVGLCYLLLYVPIVILVAYSFNDSSFIYQWQGFSLKWYYKLFGSVEILDAFINSLIVASSTVFLSLTLGVLFVFYGARTGLIRCIPLFYGSLGTPEIVIAVGLLSFLSFLSIPLGLPSLIVGHTLIGMGYVIPMVYARYTELDYRLIEASLDLGATMNQTFYNIILPLLAPALIAGGLLVFVVSLDDFILSFFCSGSSVLTLPMYIFAQIRVGTTPLVNALATVMLVLSSLLVLIYSALIIKRRV